MKNVLYICFFLGSLLILNGCSVSKNDLLNNKIKCHDLGMKEFQRLYDDGYIFTKQDVILGGIFYDSLSNSCVIEYAMVYYGDRTYSDNYIKDILTSEIIASYGDFGGSWGDFEKYTMIKKQLLSNP